LLISLGSRAHGKAIQATQRGIYVINRYTPSNPKFGAVEAYKLLLNGKRPTDLAKQKFNADTIKTALNFRDNYQNRDMLKTVIAREMGISKYTVKEMIRCYESRRERII
jgi:hypothetical protein